MDAHKEAKGHCVLEGIQNSLLVFLIHFSFSSLCAKQIEPQGSAKKRLQLVSRKFRLIADG